MKIIIKNIQNKNKIHTQSAFGINPKKKLSKQNQEFMNKIFASGFNPSKWPFYQTLLFEISLKPH